LNFIEKGGERKGRGSRNLTGGKEKRKKERHQ
jgi:hypothetical protein